MPAPNAAHVVITGASSGLGAALARGFAAQKKRMTLLGRDRLRLQKVADECLGVGATVNIACCDVRDASVMQDVLSGADNLWEVDTVIANAGIGGADVVVKREGEPADLARRIVEINLLGTVNTVAPLQDRFVARRKGRIVVMSSMAAFEGLAEAPMYAASKAAVRIYGHGLRRRLAPHGVQVNVVSPGFVTTPMSQSLPFSQPFPWSAERAAQRILRGISRNEPEIAFPWQLQWGVALSSILPISLADRAMVFASTSLRRRS
jgi:short-subunit dehydrogenase